MCGLWGFNTLETNGFSNDDMELMFSMMYMTQLRGNDSTGVCGLTTDKHLTVFRALGGVGRLLSGEGYNDKFRSHMWSKGHLAFGHGRSATKGTVTIENAHPFVVDRQEEKQKLVLAHNGTLDWNQSLPDFHKHDVDSEWIANIVAKEGPEALGKINGAMALVWYDQKDDTINFFRNADRPLHVAVAKGAYYVASEDSTLAYVRRKHGLDFEEDEILQFLPMHHAFCKVENIKDITDIKGFSSTVIKKVAYSIPTYKDSTSRSHWSDAERRWVTDYEHNAESGEVGVTRRRHLAAQALAAERRARLDQFSFERTMRNDIERLRPNGSLVRVHWEAGKCTSYWQTGGNAWHNTVDGTPYEQQLVSLERMPNNLGVVKVYEREGGRRDYVEVLFASQTPLVLLPPVKPKVEANYQKPKGEKDHSGLGLSVNQKFKPGKKFSFHTKSAKGDTIKHRGRSASNSDGASLSDYANDADGTIRIGDDILMEIAEVHIAGYNAGNKNDICKATGFRVLPGGKMDSCINAAFFTQEFTKGAIEAIGMFRGKIKAMRIQTKKEHEIDGGYVSLLVGDIKPCYSEQDQPIEGPMKEGEHVVH